LASLVPHLSLDVGGFNSSAVTQEELNFAFTSYFTWTINSSSLKLDWTNPTVLRVLNNESIFPTDYNIVSVERTAENPTWQVFVIEDSSGIGITHPIHLHGHDFWILGQETGKFDLSTSSLNLQNPPRRDVASLPGNGYLAIAFKKDNPGSWLLHCHIAWHASEGLALQFVETEAEIVSSLSSSSVMTDACSAWNTYNATEIYFQEDSGV
jgi:FtsP/CotA-like multicopper oxidase with cupredoxin domain